MNNPAKSWCFTINNWAEKDIKLLTDFEKSYLVYGKEMGESGTPHLQGYFSLKKASRLSALKKIFPTAHLEVAKDRDAAINYCMKDGDYTIIDNRKQGSRTDLLAVVETLKKGTLSDVIDEHPETFIKYHSGIEKYSQRYQQERNFKPKVVWIHGPTGTNKTRTVVEKHKSLWISLNTLKWWDGYENQEACLIDDFRGDFCTFHELLRILDRYPYTVQVKGSTRKLNSKYMYITSCYPPHKVYETREDIKQLLRRIDLVIDSSKLFSLLQLKDGEEKKCEQS